LIVGLYDRCGSVFEHLATASCSTELDEPRRPALSQTSSQSQHLAAAAADRKTSPASVISSVLGSRPKLARLHAAHALSMDVLLSMALEMGFHTHTCWKHVFRFTLTAFYITADTDFYRAMLCIVQAMLSQDVCPSICLSVCLSVTRRYSVETAKHVIRLFHHW